MDSNIEEKQLPTNDENTIEQIKEDTKFDYRKAREERIIRNTEKRILKDLGADSFDSIKETLKNHRSVLKELEDQRNNGRKLNVFSEGFDDQFVDFVTHDVGTHLKENEKFEDALKKYKKEHPQFLRGNSKVQFNTSPTFENKPITQSNHSKMNDFFRGKISSI